MKCRRCNGTGQVREDDSYMDGLWHYEMCDACYGKGKFVALRKNEVLTIGNKVGS